MSGIARLPTNLAFEVRGDGDSGRLPLLMIHGVACGRQNWGALPDMLGAHRRVATFDHRGVGASDTPEPPYSIQDLVGDARGLLDSLGWDRAHVLGTSMGGMVAQQLALDSPERVASLVLGSTTPGGRESLAPPQDFLGIFSEWQDGDRQGQRGWCENFMRFMLPEDSGACKLMDTIVDNFVAVPRSRRGLEGQVSAMGRFNRIKVLGEITCPTLVIHGDADAVMPLPNSESIARRIPGARLEVITGAGHFWWAHEPLEAASTVATFLAANDGPASSL